MQVCVALGWKPQGLVSHVVAHLIFFYRCWDQCVTGNPGQKLGYKAEGCLQNCVNRFLDSANYVANRLNTLATQQQAVPSSELS